jgi:general secretion pathway protein B
MSYLLEALRKSERERQEKSVVPGLQTPTVEWEGGDDSRGRSPWLLVAVLAICLNTVLLAVLVWRFGFSDRAPESATTSTVNDVGNANPANNSGGAAAVTTAAQMPAVIVVQQPRDANPAIVVRERADGESWGNGALPARSPSRMQTSVPTLSTRQSVTEVQQQRQQRDDADSNMMPAHESALVSDTVEQTLGNTEDKDQVPSVHALPLSVRQELPVLTMNSHIYANNPRDSFVMINGSSFSPGQVISTDLKLLAVVPEGALLEFRGQRFVLPALASFSP